jgi:hypothetical protein
MTAKEIYERIDLSQLPEEKADKLRQLEVKTKGFTISNDKVDESMRNLYAQLKEKKPSALKDLKVEIKKEEIKKGDEVIVKETEEVVGKKEVTKKTPTPSSGKKETITEVAKKIRKADEPWRTALKRAGEQMRNREDEANKQVKTELQKLIEFVKNDPNFKDFPRTYGKGRKDIDLLKDASEKALAPGRRVSKKGHMNQYGASKGGRKYTENRDNRSDREASKFPKNIFLAKGGRVHRAEQMENGGEVFVPVQILANNPDALVNTTTMTELFAEGGMAPTRKLFEDGGALYQGNMDAEYITYGEVFKSGGKLKYDPARDVQAIVIQDGTFKKMFIKGDFLGGAYRLASGGLSEDYIYVSPRKVIFARLKSGEDIKPSNGFWIKKNASGTIYTGSAKAKPAFVKSKKFPLPKKITLSYPYKENDKIMKLLGEFSGKDDLRPATTFVSIKDGELVSTNAHYLIRLIDPTTKGENELVCESKSCQNIKKTDLKYPDVDRVIESFEADFSESYDFVDLYESLMQAREDAYEKLQRRSKNTFIVTNVEFKNNDIKFDSGLLLQALKGAISLGMQKGFISYSEAKNRPIVLTPSQVTTESKYRVLAEKDLILLMPIMGSGYEFESSIVAKQVDIMEAGGEVFVPVQIDANNPDVLVQTTTMSDLFARGGYVDVQANLMKELQKLQRDLNSQRLSTYMEGDNSEEEIARQRERAAKLARFNEILDLLRELESKKMAQGGKIYASDDAYRVDVMLNGDVMETLIIRGRNKGEVRMMIEDMYEDKMEDKYGEDVMFEIIETKGDGGKIGFEALSKKVAARYMGEKVKPQYQDEYGKTYSAEEAEEVGDKVAAKVYRQQLSKMNDGGYMAKGENYEYVNTFTRFDSNVPVPQDDFEKFVEAYHKKLSGDKLDISKYNVLKLQMSNYLGSETIEKMEEYVEKTHNANNMAEGGFVAIYNGKKINIEANSLYAAKLKAIQELKVPKSKEGLLSVVSNKSMANQDFRFMADGGRLEAQSLEMAENISVQIAHHAIELKEALEGKTYIEPWVTSMLQRAADNLSDATHYLEGKEEKMAKGGRIREFDDVLIISKNRLGMVEAIADNIYYVTTPFGETFEATIDDLKKIMSFDKGGEVMIGEIASIAKENKATGDEVVKKISKGADVEMEHTEDRKVAMRIAVDHLKEDFNYYEKLSKAGL